jgi:two-component system sensor histidine kinase TtrS
LGIVELLQTSSGEKRWVRTDKIPYRDEQNEIVGVIVFAVDITDRKNAEQALQRAHDELELRVRERTAELASAVEDLRSEIAERKGAEEKVRRQQEQLAHVQRLRTIEGMASQLAHEINQPLAAIANFANGLAMRLRNGEVDRGAMIAAAAQIREQAMRAGEVIRRLRGFVRKEAARREYVDVNHLLQEAARLVETEAQHKGIAIRFRLDAEVPPIQVDHVQIEQVVVNLLRNGIDSIVEADDEAGELLVVTELLDQTIRVAIRDTGTGLPAGAEEELFEPYFTTKPDGLGMGLSISRSIIESHGGSLWAEPNRVRGMTFLFLLPVPDASRTVHPEQSQGTRK